MGSIAHEEMKCLFTFILFIYFSFVRSGVEVKRGVEFHYSTRNASRTRVPLASISVYLTRYRYTMYYMFVSLARLGKYLNSTQEVQKIRPYDHFILKDRFLWLKFLILTKPTFILLKFTLILASYRIYFNF